MTDDTLAPIPTPDPTKATQRIILEGDVPSPLNPPKGCRFHTRCRYAQPRCSAEEPLLRDAGDGQRVACHFFETIPTAVSIKPVDVAGSKFDIRLAAFEAAKKRAADMAG